MTNLYIIHKYDTALQYVQPLGHTGGVGGWGGCRKSPVFCPTGLKEVIGL